MRKIFFLGAIILLSTGFAAKKVQASFVDGQFDFAEEYHMVFPDDIYQSLPPVNATITRVTLRAKNDNSSVLRVAIQDLTDTLDSGIIGTAVSFPTTSPEFIDIEITPYHMQSDHLYRLRFNTNAGNWFFYGTSDTTTYDCGLAVPQYPCTPIESMYWVLDDGVTPDLATVQLNPRYFVDGMSVADFSFWQTIATGLTIGDIYGVAVGWGTSTPDQYVAPIQAFMAIIPEMLVTQNKTPSSTPGSFVASATLYKLEAGNWQFVSASEVIDYEIIVGSLTDFPPDLEPDDISLVPPCSDTGFAIGFLGGGVIDFGKGICQVVRFLFVPSNFSLDRWRNLVDDFKATFPFSMYFGFKDIIDTAEIQTENIEPLLFSYNATGSPVGNLSINADEVLTATVGQDNRDTVYGFMTIALYFGFGVYMLFRIKNFFG